MIPMGVVRLPGVEFIFRVKPTVGPLHSCPRFFISQLPAVGTNGLLAALLLVNKARGRRPRVWGRRANSQKLLAT
jgi:hypothetical protein